MNLEILISIDGESLPLNDELQSTVSSVINSYIKHKVSGVKAKEKKPRIPKDPNAPKRPARPHLSDQELSELLKRGSELSHLTVSQASKIVSQELGRAMGTTYTRLRNAEKSGILKFAAYVPHYNRN